MSPPIRIDAMLSWDWLDAERLRQAWTDLEAEVVVLRRQVQVVGRQK